MRAAFAVAAVSVLLDRAAKEQRNTFYTVDVAAELRMICQIIKISWYEYAYVRAPAPSPAVRNILGSNIGSATNHKFKRLEPHFQFWAGMKRDRETAVALPHSHRSPPRSPYLSCQILVQRKSSELEQIYGISYRNQ